MTNSSNSLISSRLIVLLEQIRIEQEKRGAKKDGN